MGNIVSNPGTTVQLPDAQPATVSGPPTPPTQATSENAAMGSIEGVGTPAPETGFGIDPFGPMASQTAPPELPTSAAEPPSITPEPPPPPAEEPPITPPAQGVTVPGTPGNKLDAATLLSQMPDIQKMMKDLEKSGCLLPELKVNPSEHVDTSPLAALQPQHLKDQTYFSKPSNEVVKPILPEVQLASTYAAKPQTRTKEEHELPLYIFTAAICFLQALQGAAQVTHFVLIRYPQYEQLVIATQLTTNDVNSTVIKAVFIGFMVVITLLLLLSLIFKRPKNHSPALYFSVVVIVFNFFVQNVMAGGEFVSGSPLLLPSILSEIISRH